MLWCSLSAATLRSETSFELDGDLIVVDAIALGPGGQAEVRLVLDTGAVLTTLTPTIAESIGYTSAARVARSARRELHAHRLREPTAHGLLL